MEQLEEHGHSFEIAKALNNTGLLIGIDRDNDALKAAKQKLAEYKNVEYIHGNHDNIKEILEELEIEKVDGILLDLGVSSYQIDNKERGFSYMEDEAPLDMRMDKTSDFTAKDLINTYSEDRLYEIINKYGEERFARKIAKNIVLARKDGIIEKAGDLTQIIKKSIPAKFQESGHPAKRTFQAIRIEVNNELEPLYDTVVSSINALKPHGRLCIITFHSLEDRAVKTAYNKAEGICTCPKELPYCVCGKVSLGKVINKKPIVANEKEQLENSRAKSAKLRIFEKN